MKQGDEAMLLGLLDQLRPAGSGWKQSRSIMAGEAKRGSEQRMEDFEKHILSGLLQILADDLTDLVQPVITTGNGQPFDRKQLHDTTESIQFSDQADAIRHIHPAQRAEQSHQAFAWAERCGGGSESAGLSPATFQ